MSTGSDPANGGFWVPDGVFTLFQDTSASASSSFSMSLPSQLSGSASLLQGVDVTATGANPIQCFAHLTSPAGSIFWWDSQSTGEGNGVRWTWRGGLWVRHTQTVTFTGSTASGSINWGGIMWGILIPSYF